MTPLDPNPMENAALPPTQAEVGQDVTLPVKGTLMEQAETRTEEANLRTEQANKSTEEANTRTVEANARTVQANTRTERAELRSEMAEARIAQLRDSEVSYRRLFEAARDGILILDIDTGRIADVNPFLVELLGFSRDEMMGKTVGELSPFKDILSNQLMLERLQREGYVRHENLPLETRDGRHIAVEFVSNVYQAGDKQVIQCNVRNITERKEAEKALLESGRFNRATLDALDAHLAVLDKDGKILATNQAWREFAEANSADWRAVSEGVNYLTICEAAEARGDLDAAQTLTGIRKVVAGALGTWTYEYPCHSPTEQRWFTCRVTRFPGEGPVRVVVAHEDITERKQAEASLTDSQQRLALATESAHIGVWDWNAAASQLVWDAQMYRLYGTSEHESGGAYEVWSKGIHAEDRERCEAEIVAVLASGEDFHSEFRVVWPGGEVRDLEAHGMVQRQGEGAATRMIGVNWDITARKKAEAERIKLEGQYRQAQKMESVGQLAGGIAHDFNNILTVIMMQTQLAELAENVPVQVREGLVGIRGAAERAANLTRQLLLFSRKQVMQPQLVDLNQVVSNLSQMLRRVIREDVALHLHLQSTPLMVYADPGMLDQVLMNLAVNARDAMPQGGRIIIETAEKIIDAEQAANTAEAEMVAGRYVWLSISDTGTGMTPEVQTHIFEPFYTTKEVGNGTGLGLATVFGVVKQHLGWIKVYSEAGKGTTFQIFLPASDESAEARTAKTVSQARPRGGTETILLAEDDKAVRKLTRVLLERSGYEVLEAEDGVLAQLIWGEQHDRIALLLTDLVMPGGMDGRELAARLLVQKPGLKVIFTSGYSADIAGRELKLEAGQSFVQKPCPPSQLLEIVRKCLDS